MYISEVLKAHSNELFDAFANTPFIVFLCGPSLSEAKTKASAEARLRIKNALESAKFNVVLGEDEGLDNEQLKSLGFNAQDNELEFIRTSCNAVVLIADSVGSFCELGLFSWHYVHENGVIQASRRPDFILLIDKQYQSGKSYLNAGPAIAVQAFGHLEYVDFRSYEPESIVARLKRRRAVHTVDRRGRPKKSKPRPASQRPKKTEEGDNEGVLGQKAKQ